MPKSKPLTASQVKQAKTEDKPYKLSDEKGMFLLVHPNGSKYWRLKYRYAGKEKLLALGVYPEVSLANARIKRADARRLLDNDIDPGQAKKAHKRTLHQESENSFESIATEWFHTKMRDKSESHQKRTWSALKKDLFTQVGSRPISQITAPELLGADAQPVQLLMVNIPDHTPLPPPRVKVSVVPRLIVELLFSVRLPKD